MYHHQIKNIATQHETYIQDTPDFLRIIDKINRGPTLDPNTLLVSMDASSLYTNIIHEEGLNSLHEALEKRDNPKVPTKFLLDLMEIILRENIFEFHNQLWRQEIGAAMGSPPVLHYANVFMAQIDQIIKILGSKYNDAEKEALRLLKRFFDDYFLLFVGTTRLLHKFLEEINRINSTIQLTINHASNENEAMEDRCDCESKSAIPFLDTLVSVKEGHIKVDLYKKETDCNQYLLPSSCHNKSVTTSIPFSLGLRIVRTCTDPIDRDTRLNELKDFLLAREYNEKSIDSAISRARGIPRQKALKKVKRLKIKMVLYLQLHMILGSLQLGLYMRNTGGLWHIKIGTWQKYSRSLPSLHSKDKRTSDNI